MKAVFVTPWAELSGGAEQVLWMLLGTIDRAAVEPSVVFLTHGPLAKDVATLGVETHVVEAGRLRNLPRFPRTVSRLRQIVRDADVVVAWMPKAHLYTALTGRGRPRVWWQHGIPAGGWLDRVVTLLPADLVLCYSTTAAAAQRALGPERRVEVVHVGIELGEPARPQKLNVPEGTVVVGIVGRLQPWKGQHHVIRATALLRSRGHNVHALLVGGTPFGLSPKYPETLRALAETEGVTEHVTFTGQIADPSSYVSAMDVVVNASAPEPWGLVVLEAMAQGRPVVAFAAGGPAEIVEDGVTGLLVEPFTTEALADALEHLVTDPQLRERMGTAGRERVAQCFEPTAMARRVEQLLADVAS